MICEEEPDFPATQRQLTFAESEYLEDGQGGLVGGPGLPSLKRAFSEEEQEPAPSLQQPMKRTRSDILDPAEAEGPAALDNTNPEQPTGTEQNIPRSQALAAPATAPTEALPAPDATKQLQAEPTATEAKQPDQQNIPRSQALEAPTAPTEALPAPDATKQLQAEPSATEAKQPDQQNIPRSQALEAPTAPPTEALPAPEATNTKQLQAEPIPTQGKQPDQQNIPHSQALEAPATAPTEALPASHAPTQLLALAALHATAPQPPAGPAQQLPQGPSTLPGQHGQQPTHAPISPAQQTKQSAHPEQQLAPTASTAQKQPSPCETSATANAIAAPAPAPHQATTATIQSLPSQPVHPLQNQETGQVQAQPPLQQQPSPSKQQPTPTSHQQQLAGLPANPPTAAAIDRRLRRIMAPTKGGDFKVSAKIRALWDDQDQRPQVLQLFASCQFDTDRACQNDFFK